MCQTPFFWGQFLLPEGQEGFLGLLDYWAGDPMDLLTCVKFRKLYLKIFSLSIQMIPQPVCEAQRTLVTTIPLGRYTHYAIFTLDFVLLITRFL